MLFILLNQLSNGYLWDFFSWYCCFVLFFWKIESYFTLECCLWWFVVDGNWHCALYWSQDKMAAILQTTFSNYFSCMDSFIMIQISLKFVLKGSVKNKPAPPDPWPVLKFQENILKIWCLFLINHTRILNFVHILSMNVCFQELGHKLWKFC